MSTTRSTATLGKSAQMRIRHAWSEITQHLPFPGYTWRWGETDLSHKTLYRLKEKHLIVPVLEGERLWKTTRKLWLYVIEKAGDGEAVGAQVGEEITDASTGASGASRVFRDLSLPVGSGERQATLTGGIASRDDVGVSTSEREGNAVDDETSDEAWQSTLNRAAVDAGERAAERTSVTQHSSTTFSVT